MTQKIWVILKVHSGSTLFRVFFSLLPISQDPFNTILPTIYHHCCILDDILIIFWDHNIFKDIYFLFWINCAIPKSSFFTKFYLEEENCHILKNVLLFYRDFMSNLDKMRVNELGEYLKVLWYNINLLQTYPGFKHQNPKIETKVQLRRCTQLSILRWTWR